MTTEQKNDGGPAFPIEAAKSLPNDWCEDCLYTLLRLSRKNTVECCDCGSLNFGEEINQLDDYNAEAITTILKWAQQKADAMIAERGGE